ncbi:MAG: hypothetical protein Sapg2KO_11650 [Saprospiraceae bacterium]
MGLSQHNLSLAYFGETFTHSGFSLTHNKYLKTWDKKKVTRRGKEKAKTIVLNWSSRYAFYHHKRNHSGNILSTGADLGLYRAKGSYLEFGLFLGSNLKFLNEDTYRVNGNGAVEKINNANNLTFVYGLRTSVGKYIRYQETDHPIALFLGSNIFFSTPFGTNTLLQSAIEAGVKYHL